MIEYANIEYLIQQLVSGKNEAWSYFLKKYGRLIYHCINQAIFKLGHHVSHEERYDCFQEILTRLLEDNYRRLKNIHSYDEKAFRVYLGAITYRSTLNFFRSAKGPIFLSNEVLCLVPDTSSSPSKEIFRKQLIDIITSELNQRETLVVLYFLDGLTLAEIAQLMGIGITTAHKIKDNAIWTIKKILKEGKKNKNSVSNEQKVLLK